MKSITSPVSSFANPFALWGSFAVKTMEMSAAAAQVITIRAGRMASAGVNPSDDDRREMELMGTEKLEAFSRAGSTIATGIAPVMAGMASQAFRTGMDVFHAATRLAASRSLPQTLQHQQLFADTLLRHAPAMNPGASATATARLAHRALEPMYTAATANAKRLTTDAK